METEHPHREGTAPSHPAKTMTHENDDPVSRDQDNLHEREGRPERNDVAYTSEDKYLALEQSGVSYTKTPEDLTLSDTREFGNETETQRFHTNGENSRNADAFSQDDFLLRYNLEGDDHQGTSISSDEATDGAATDETPLP